MWSAVAASLFVIFALNFVRRSDAATENRRNAGVEIDGLDPLSLSGEYRRDAEVWIEQLESSLQEFNSISALLTWELYVSPSTQTAARAIQVGVVRNGWKNRACASNVKLDLLTDEEQRKLYLFCRGPRYTDGMALQYLRSLGKLQEIFNSEICIPDEPLLNTADQNATVTSLRGRCVHGEPDLERLMKRPDLKAEQYKWIWTTWHNFVGPPMREIYPELVRLENEAAQNNGYRNMGEIWKEELNMPNLEETVFALYEEIKPLYLMLHAVVRHKLSLKYGTSSMVDASGPIPVHLLGNMWGQDWSSLIDLFVTSDGVPDLNERIQKKKWRVKDMVLRAEDMYTSLGLPKMTEKFWRRSVFEGTANGTSCHGTAANMYSNDDDDYRILMCGKVDMENFYVIHHEMGHVEYFMAYKNASSIFQDGANSALHESIGDAIMNGVMTPQHLNRLGFLTDSELFSEGVDLFLLMKQALAKIPEIPYSLVLDKYRWDVFSGRIPRENYNEAYWTLNERIRGVSPPERRGEQFFDPGGKFHVPDNTPYIRYFLSSVLQMEIYKGLCELSLYGTHWPEASGFKDAISFLPLHRCDIYGSKKCGKRLLAMMSKGSGISWSQALRLLTGKGYITTKPLLEYYAPIYKWLRIYIDTYNVPVGW